MQDIKPFIRNVKDFPKPGIMFRDITTLLQNSDSLKQTIDLLYEQVKDLKIDKICGIESRGFIFGAMLAEKIGCGFIPIRKPGKLPAEVVKESYSLEYGTDTIEIHKDSIEKGDRILLHDDLLATGGTMKAACNLVEKLGGEIAHISFIVELSFLNGRKELSKYNISALADYDSED